MTLGDVARKLNTCESPRPISQIRHPICLNRRKALYDACFISGNKCMSQDKMKFFLILAAVIALGAAKPSAWTLQELEVALKDPNTDPAIVPYLQVALNKIMEAILAGETIDSIVVPIPGDYVKPIIDPSPAEVPEEVPAPQPIVPEPEPEPQPEIRSPLVQVIVNVKSQKDTAESPAIVPSPVDISENQPIVNPIDIIAN
ncbi:unnamed protein product [Leptosia nina]|uniref:Uncharacterized protein n=1 Tax=Leptosia nina TaxID=320188 RepID=A0AAV1J1F5_9NEOP